MQTEESTLSNRRDIAPRSLSLSIAKDAPRYWMQGDPFATHLMNALSITFPEGESFFVASVRKLRHEVKDPRLEAQVRGFLAQESLHRREHSTLNEWMQSQGIDVERYEREIKHILDRPRKRATPTMQLAVTCALEHLTATMAEMWLTTPELQQSAHESVRPLWNWHAIEEIDHKAVAYDVYVAAGGSYAVRVSAMVSATVILIAQVNRMQMRMLHKDGELTVRNLARGVLRFWGPRGYFTRMLPAYFRYFRPGFHPWQHDDSALVTRFERELGAYLSSAPTT